MQEIAIKTSNLTKSFGDNVAVNALNLEVRKGELYGLVGPDGAGKTTTMRLLTAIMDPSSGDAWVAGHSIISEGEPLKEKIGYMSQRFSLSETRRRMPASRYRVRATPGDYTGRRRVSERRSASISSRRAGGICASAA